MSRVRRTRRGFSAMVVALAVASCLRPPSPASGPAPVGSTTAPNVATAPTNAAGSAAPRGDRLGARPTPEAIARFQPPAPAPFDGPHGSKTWLLERHSLPLVAVAVVIPYGSAADPKDKWGLTFAVGQMLSEGAGDRDAMAFTQALRDIGATISVRTERDMSVVSLQVLSDKLDRGLDLLADAVARPRFAAKDFERVHALWSNALEARAQDPAGVARVVTSIAAYGPGNPYGHPTDGTRASAARVRLADAIPWHRSIWRPDVARLVVVGDVTRDALGKSLERSFGSWKAPGAAALRPPTPPPATLGKKVHAIVVDRPDAPQVVLSVARPAVSAADADEPGLDLMNVALGGSFTSRLNQSLREEHGWTYGARTSFTGQRSAGLFHGRAAIRSDAITEALVETWKVIGQMGTGGLTADEMLRVRAQTQGDALAAYGTVASVAHALADDTGLDLPPDHDARVLAEQLELTKDKLDALARKYLDLAGATVVLVGPRALAEKALAAAQLPVPELWDAEGRRLR